MMVPLRLKYFVANLLLTNAIISECSAFDPEASITGLYTGPYFDPLAEKNLTAHLEDRAVLPCTVRQLGDKSVSWIRKRDSDILTVDRYTFVSDDRFEARYSKPHETWNLVIMYVQQRDAGLYECQVSTEPKMSQLFSLRVVVPKVRMVPPDDRFVQAGSTVSIDCEITEVVQQPDYIFWYHNRMRVLEHQDPNIEVVVKDTGAESMVSTLTIKSVRRKESGNYTCMPSNLHSASALLHVLEEEHQAAMQDGRNTSERADFQFRILVFLLFVGYFISYYCTMDHLNKANRLTVINEAPSVNIMHNVVPSLSAVVYTLSIDCNLFLYSTYHQLLKRTFQIESDMKKNLSEMFMLINVDLPADREKGKIVKSEGAQHGSGDMHFVLNLHHISNKSHPDTDVVRHLSLR